MSEGRVAVVTGAAGGIGQAIASALASNGYRVFGTTRQSVAELRDREARQEMVQLDVGDADSVDRCFREILATAGRIDVLVNNAGVSLTGALEETDLDEAKAVFETNLFGVMRVTNAVLPVMRAQGGGRIVNISSVTGFTPVPYSGVYAASKHALEGYSESLDHEVRQFGIRVCLVAPGYIRTRIDEHTARARACIDAYSCERERAVVAMAAGLENGESPCVVANGVLAALAARTPRSRYLAGRGARVVGLMKRFLPASILAKGVRQQVGLD